jgi:hypothetical protein
MVASFGPWIRARGNISTTTRTTPLIICLTRRVTGHPAAGTRKAPRHLLGSIETVVGPGGGCASCRPHGRWRSYRHDSSDPMLPPRANRATCVLCWANTATGREHSNHWPMRGKSNHDHIKVVQRVRCWSLLAGSDPFPPGCNRNRSSCTHWDGGWLVATDGWEGTARVDTEGAKGAAPPGGGGGRPRVRSSAPSLNISSPRVQTQEITARGNDLYTTHFTLPTNFSPTHQPTYFCLISRNAYILTQNLNPINAYIERRRKYGDPRTRTVAPLYPCSCSSMLVRCAKGSIPSAR